jgi:hypothetical protein
VQLTVNSQTTPSVSLRVLRGPSTVSAPEGDTKADPRPCSAARDFSQRGWVLTGEADGNPIRSVTTLAAGAELVLNFHDGRTTAAVTTATSRIALVARSQRSSRSCPVRQTLRRRVVRRASQSLLAISLRLAHNIRIHCIDRSFTQSATSWPANSTAGFK